jgi:DNA-directed RNA polymerase subunit K/omega
MTKKSKLSDNTDISETNDISDNKSDISDIKSEISDNESEILDTEDVVNNQCIFEELVENNISDDIPTVENDKRISRNLLTSYEMVRILGERQKQLTMGAKPMIVHDKSLTYENIAVEELILNVIPFKIRRYIHNHYELWDVNELKKDHLLSLLN